MSSGVARKLWRSDDFAMSSMDQCTIAGTSWARRQAEILVGASQVHQNSTNKSSTQTPKTSPYISWTSRLPAICCVKLCHDLCHGNCPNWKIVSHWGIAETHAALGSARASSRLSTLSREGRLDYNRVALVPITNIEIFFCARITCELEVFCLKLPVAPLSQFRLDRVDVPGVTVSIHRLERILLWCRFPFQG